MKAYSIILLLLASTLLTQCVNAPAQQAAFANQSATFAAQVAPAHQAQIARQ